MSFEDMIKYFSSINVCMVRSSLVNENPWSETRRKFYFKYGPKIVEGKETSDEWSVSSPSYILTVYSPGTFIFSVHQEDIRCATSEPYIDIGVSVLKPDSLYGTFSLITAVNNIFCIAEISFKSFITILRLETALSDKINQKRP
jgi:hypothetical protein